MSKFNTSITNGSVNAGDDFDSVAEVTHLFGMTAERLPYSNAFHVPGAKDTIGWMPSEVGGNGWHNIPEYGPWTDDKGFQEVLLIREYNDSADETSKRLAEELAHPLTRRVFWRMSHDGANWYKAVGQFSIDADATRATIETDQPCVIYRRTSLSFPCVKTETSVRAFTDAEFAALKGQDVEIRLRDRISFRADCGDTVNRELSLWPGTRLHVTSVSDNRIYVVGTSQSADLRADTLAVLPVKMRSNVKGDIHYYIPCRDFELGYVAVLPLDATTCDNEIAK